MLSGLLVSMPTTLVSCFDHLKMLPLFYFLPGLAQTFLTGALVYSIKKKMTQYPEVAPRYILEQASSFGLEFCYFVYSLAFNLFVFFLMISLP